MNLRQLKGIFPSAKDDWLNSIINLAPQFGLSSVQRQAAFLGQLWHESVGLTRFEESMLYTAPRLMAVWPKRFPNDSIAEQYAKNPEKLANNVYANRMGNGDEASGDGWRYHGRGPIQLTGRDNYYVCSVDTRLPLLEQPELLLTPNPGVTSACWYWKLNGLNELADGERHEEITKRINGGLIGLEERLKYVRLAQDILSA